MIWFLFGVIILFVLIGGASAFERSSVTSIKALLAWVVALGGLSLALLLVLSGKGGIALGALTLFGPLLYQKWRSMRVQRPEGPKVKRGSDTMTRQEAFEILGLPLTASEIDIREAYHRLMRGVHPDAGGSDWLASRINQARDTLLR